MDDLDRSLATSLVDVATEEGSEVVDCHQNQLVVGEVEEVKEAVAAAAVVVAVDDDDDVAVVGPF